jgi:hypothetical protein
MTADEMLWRLVRERNEALAEVERLRAENERLHREAACEGGDLLRAALLAEVERLYNEDTKTRHALKGWVFVCPDGGADPTHERVAAVVAEVERLRAWNARLRAQVAEYFREPATHPVEREE